MTSTAVSCTHCRGELPTGLFNQPALTPCPHCRVPLQVEVFPALFRRRTPGRRGEATVEDTEAGCFYHPQKRAVQPCDACGRFLCALCDCDLDGRHLCPTCLETGRTKGKIKSLENHRIIYDNLALGLAVFSFVPPIIYFCWLTAPMSIYVALRYWNAPLSLVRRSKVRFVLAMIIGLLDIAALIALIVVLVTKGKF